jgi:ribosome-binding protein aMBF1 (putative translation factor)
MLTPERLVKKMLKNPRVRSEYEAQAEEFDLLDELLRARRRAGLTQADVAARMGTQTPAVARLERAAEAGGTPRRSPPSGSMRGRSGVN